MGTCSYVLVGTDKVQSRSYAPPFNPLPPCFNPAPQTAKRKTRVLEAGAPGALRRGVLEAGAAGHCGAKP